VPVTLLLELKKSIGITG